MNLLDRSVTVEDCIQQKLVVGVSDNGDDISLLKLEAAYRMQNLALAEYGGNYGSVRKLDFAQQLILTGFMLDFVIEDFIVIVNGYTHLPLAYRSGGAWSVNVKEFRHRKNGGSLYQQREYHHHEGDVEEDVSVRNVIHDRVDSQYDRY